jgi:hypothetical protein
MHSRPALERNAQLARPRLLLLRGSRRYICDANERRDAQQNESAEETLSEFAYESHLLSSSSPIDRMEG